MKTLINHLVNNNFDEILAKSLLNCHVEGVHSIMLLNSPGKTIRMYIAVPGNDLETPTANVFKPTPEMPLSIHPHHCNLTLQCITGILVNWQFKETHDIEFGTKNYNKYFYSSKITGPEMKFEKLGQTRLLTEKRSILDPNESISMPASALHTVTTRPGIFTAWLVFEGKEDPEYIPYCYSMHQNLNNINTAGLYIKPTKEQILNLLNQL